MTLNDWSALRLLRCKRKNFRSDTVQWACRLNCDIKPILIQSSGLFNISKTLLFIPAISSRFSFQSSTDVSKLSKHASMRRFNDPCLGWNESFGGKYVRWNLVMNWGHIIIFKLDFFYYDTKVDLIHHASLNATYAVYSWKLQERTLRMMHVKMTTSPIIRMIPKVRILWPIA